MDRSFLSQPEVVAAARNFTCNRLATYEDAEEARLLESVFRGGSGQLENTVFVIMTPDGRQNLTRAHRGPRHLFRDAAEMAETMNALAARYRGAAARTAATTLPVVKDVRLALNVAACDGAPLVIAYGRTAAEVARVESALAGLAWDPRFLGQAVYVRAVGPKALTGVNGATITAGALVVRPDTYGMSGRVSQQAPTFAAPAYATALASARPTRGEDSRSHVRQGHQSGIRWETEVPVTDPHGRY